MFASLLILGRQPALGIAELESLYESALLTSINKETVLLDVDPQNVNFSRLGGSVKLARVISEIDTSNWSQLVDYLISKVPEQLAQRPAGKIKFGLSVYGLSATPQQINRSTLALKKAIKASGRSVRIVPNNAQTLNSAQVLYNQLTSDLGMELLFIRNGAKTILAQTIREQDIDAYAARDQERPKRDARIGMLPPKLAQIIINLCNPKPGQTMLDPFCGTGVILQEAVLMGIDAMGSDLDPRMVEYTKENITWLKKVASFGGSLIEVEEADATSFEWKHPFGAIACETYLGRPFSSKPTQEVLREVMQDVDTIHRKFLRNVVARTIPGFRMCIAVPAWKTHEGFKHLKCLDSLEEIGYTRMKFVDVADDDLIYHREGQIVARELVVLTRK